MGNYSYIIDSARLIVHGGVLALSLYVFGYLALAWLDMAGAFYHPEVSIGYLFRFIAWLFGPHPLTFWDGFADTIALVSHIIVEPLRVCLIASTVAYCLEQVQKDAKLQQQPHRDPAVELDDVHRRRHRIVRQQERELKQPGWLHRLVTPSVAGG